MGGCAIEAEGLCRLALPGYTGRARRFEEGILRLWMGGLVAHPLRWEFGGEGSKNCKWWAAGEKLYELPNCHESRTSQHSQGTPHVLGQSPRLRGAPQARLEKRSADARRMI